MIARPSRESRATTALVICVECLHCRHRGLIGEHVLKRYGLLANAPIVRPSEREGFSHNPGGRALICRGGVAALGLRIDPHRPTTVAPAQTAQIIRTDTRKAIPITTAEPIPARSTAKSRGIESTDASETGSITMLHRFSAELLHIPVPVRSL